MGAVVFRHRFAPFLMAFIVLAFSSLAFSVPATVAVGTCLTNLAHYPTIQIAVTTVLPGSTIKLCPGTYMEQVLITKSLTLTGVAANGLTGTTAVGANNPVIAPPPTPGIVQNAADLFDSSPIGAQIAVVTPSPGSPPIVVNISNVTIDGANNLITGCGPDFMGIYYQNASGTVNHVVTRNQALSTSLDGCQSGEGIFVQSGYGTGGTAVVTIENSNVHNYQKNGITADGSGTMATISANSVVGQGPTMGAAENGIQVSDGANGKVLNNTVADDVYSPGTVGASGILIFDSGATMSAPLTISGNVVSNTQFGIVTFADSSGTADFNKITLNKVTNTHLDDGLDLCSNNNNVTLNTVTTSDGAGIHIDSSCTESSGPSGNTTSVSNNTINEACAGVLTGTGAMNTLSGNSTSNVVETTFAGDFCPVGMSLASMRTMARPRPLPRRHR